MGYGEQVLGDRVKILVTGFEPFGGESVNPSKAVLTPLQARFPQICISVLPVEFERSWAVLQNELERHTPQVVLCLGEAGGRSKISLEHAALNWADARIPDHAGAQPRDLKLLECGPNALFSTLPLRALEERLRALELPVEISYSAGTYVCNALFFNLMNSLEGTNVLAGFVHLPYLPQQTLDKPGKPSLALERVVWALEEMLRVLAAPTMPDSRALPP